MQYNDDSTSNTPLKVNLQILTNTNSNPMLCQHEAKILQMLHLPTSLHNVEISPKLTRNEPNPISKQRRRIIQILNYTGNL